MLRAFSNTQQQAGARLIVTKQNGRNRPNGPKHKQSHVLARNSPNEPVWLWGIHAVEAAVANPKREILRLVVTPNARRKMMLDGAEEMAARDIDRLLPPGAVHQGVAMLAKPLPAVGLAEIIARKVKRVAVLDQVSDPHNLGAVLRSAAAFGVEALVVQTRHSPPVTGIVAKSAAGAVEMVTECRVVNIARALDELGQAGYCTIGLAGEADAELGKVIPAGDPIALVFGAEGAGLRPAVAKACTWLARIPIGAQMESLNISNAAAIAFYEAARSSS